MRESQELQHTIGTWQVSSNPACSCTSPVAHNPLDAKDQTSVSKVLRTSNIVCFQYWLQRYNGSRVSAAELLSMTTCHQQGPGAIRGEAGFRVPVQTLTGCYSAHRFCIAWNQLQPGAQRTVPDGAVEYCLTEDISRSCLTAFDLYSYTPRQ